MTPSFLFASPAAGSNHTNNAWSFSFDALMGVDPIRLSDYQGKVILLVNTASQCSFTGQYEGLEKLYQQYKDQGLIVIGIPSNDFGSQEPGSSEEIAAFCQLNYGVSFPMTAKYSVSGRDAHPFYRWAKETLGFGTAPKWNFHKYLVDRHGTLVDYFYSATRPQSSRLVKAVTSALRQKQRDFATDAMMPE